MKEYKDNMTQQDNFYMPTVNLMQSIFQPRNFCRCLTYLLDYMFQWDMLCTVQMRPKNMFQLYIVCKMFDPDYPGTIQLCSLCMTQIVQQTKLFLVCMFGMSFCLQPMKVAKLAKIQMTKHKHQLSCIGSSHCWPQMCH